MLLNTAEVENQVGTSVLGTVPPAPEAFHEVARMKSPIVIAKPETLAAGALVQLAGALKERRPVAVQQ